MIVAAAIVAAAVVAVALRAPLARARAPRLPAAAHASGVTALLPVRDEERNLEGCLAALLPQPGVERVLVLDDSSRDRTAALAAAAAARDARVAVRAVPEPPAGASGKLHALAHGARAAATEWILCLDADARPGEAAVARALAAARAHRLDAVSLAARQRVGSLGEALVTPLVFGLLDLRLGDWRRAARGEGPPVANGQFFLLRRAALERAGGFDAVAGEPLDDVALARRLAAHGFRVGFWRGRDALTVRMYEGLRGSFLGWRRNLALILGDRRGAVAAAIAIALAPALAAAAALAAGAPRAALLAWAGGAFASAALRAGTGSSALFALLYPLDGLAFSACLAAAARDRARGRLVPWRGRALAPPAGGAATQSRADSGAA
ncbi:MAG TPA: glycosyltransferase family 2 protein [Thermoanaerobaculia bacterium]